MSAPAPTNRPQTFRKAERLTSRLVFELLMKQGKSIHEAPVRLVWIQHKLNTPFPAQAAFAVPKKNFKSSVDRNRIKRMMREVYRKNKEGFYPLLRKKEQQAALLMIYTGRKLPEFIELEEKLSLILKRLAEIF